MAQMRSGSLRMGGKDASRIARALALSICLHLVVVGGYRLGNKLGIWQAMRVPAWLRPPGMLTELFKKKDDRVQPPKPQEIPLVFIDVSPAQATPEPPKDAKFYSDKNALAANPNPKKDLNVPEIDGRQTHVAKTEDVPKPTLPILSPTPTPPALTAPEPEPELKPRATLTPGDLVMAKPDPVLQKGEGDAPKPRPRTVEEALARLGDNKLPGPKMKQDGGARRTLDISSFDVRATPFGDYDAYLVSLIAHRWYSLLDQQSFASDGYGKVVLDFNMHSDGSVTDMKITEHTVGEGLALLCQFAVVQQSPYKHWSIEMRRMFGESRHIQFTFHYE